jgi:hypothetical protein
MLIYLDNMPIGALLPLKQRLAEAGLWQKRQAYREIRVGVAF